MKQDFSNVSFSTGVHSPLAAEEGSACRSVKKPFCPRYEGIKKVLAEGRAVPPGKRATAQALLLTFLAGEK